jgi:hypothetical protein
MRMDRIYNNQRVNACMLLCRLQYVNKAASTMRSALKEPAKRQAMTQEVFSYKKSSWEGGNQGPKTLVQSLKDAGQL